MTERELFEAIGHVDDDLILAADAPLKKRRKPPVYWRQLVSVAACACIFLGGVEDSFDAAETGRIISDFLRTLPEETRNIFLRRYWYCDATADIAARYGLTESKVRVTLHRTRGKLAAYLQERGAAL